MDVVFPVIANPLLYLGLTVLAFMKGANAAQKTFDDFAQLSAQIYYLFGVTFLAFSGVLWRLMEG